MTTPRKAADCPKCGCLLPPSGFCARCALADSRLLEYDEIQDEPSISPAPTPERQRLFGRFELIGTGEGGGKGVVYQVRELRTGRLVGLKVMQGQCLREPNEVRRFQNEVRALASLDHPHILPIYEAGEHHGQHFYTMKWIAEGSLGQQLSRWQLPTAPVSLRGERQKAIARLMLQVARAIHFAHEQGILHRDLKPGNILVDGQGHPYVADFGLAKFMQQEAKADMTMAGYALGTAAYMSPEQAEGNPRAVTPASDLWALGVILYELLAGCRPFEGESDWAILEKVKKEDAVKPSSAYKPDPTTASDRARERMDRNLETICLKCLEKEADQRYSSAQALAEELERWLKGEPILARPAGLVERTWKWIRRHPLQTRLIGILVACLILAAGAVTWQRNRFLSQTDEITFQWQERGALQLAEKDFAENQTAQAILRLAGLLRRNPTNHLAAERLLNALAFHSFVVPAGLPFPGNAYLAGGSEDGQFLALAGTNDPPVCARVFELRSGQPILEHRGTNPIYALALSPKGRQLALGLERQVRLINPLRQNSGPDFAMPHGPVRQLLFPREEVLLAVADKTVLLWDSTSATLLRTFTAAEPVVKAACHAASGWLAVANESGSIHVWRMDSGQELIRLEANPPRVARQLSFNRDGSMLVCASAGAVNSARVWHIPSGRLLAELPHQAGVYDADFSPDDTHLLTACRDGGIRRWELATRTIRGNVMGGYSNAVNIARYNANGQRIITASDDGELRVWNGANGAPVSAPAHFNRPIIEARFLQGDADLLVLVESEGAYRLNRTPVLRWLRLAEPQAAPPLIRLPDDELVHFALGQSRESIRGILSPEGSKVITTIGNVADIWDRGQRKKVGESLKHEDLINCVRFSPDGRRVVTSTRDRRLRVWDAQSGAPLTDWIPSEAGVPDVWFTPDSGMLMTAQARIWPLFTVTDSVPSWLPGLASSIVGHRFNSPGGVDAAPLDAFATFKIPRTGLAPESRLGEWISQLTQAEKSEFLDGEERR